MDGCPGPHAGVPNRCPCAMWARTEARRCASPGPAGAAPPPPSDEGESSRGRAEATADEPLGRTEHALVDEIALIVWRLKVGV